MADKDFKGFKKDSDTYNCYDTTARSSINSLTPRVGIAEGKITTLQEQMLSVEDDLDTLGTASTKNSTSVVTESSDLVESGAVKDIVGWGNKNLLDSSHGILCQYSADPTALRWGYKPITLEAGTYTISYTQNTAFELYLVYTDDWSQITLTPTGTTITLNTSREVFVRSSLTGSNTESDFFEKFSNVQIEVGSTATAYEPYHASVEETLRDAEVIDGKNLWEFGNQTPSDYNSLKFSKVLSAGTYILSAKVTTTYSGNMVDARFRKENTSSLLVVTLPANTGKVESVEFTLNEPAYYVFVYASTGNDSYVCSWENIMLRKATETDPTYEPYYIPLKDVVPTKVSYADNGVLGAKNWWILENVNGLGTGVTFTLNADKTVSLSAGTTSSECYFPGGAGSDLYNLLPDMDYIVSYGKTAIANLQIQVLYKTTPESSWATLASESSKSYCKFTTPSTLYKVWIRLLITNNKTVTANTLYPMIKLASDTSDDFVPYVMTNRELTVNKADNSVIAPTENNATASQDYAVGDYFIKDAILGKTKAAIASGGTFTKDTNYEETNVAKELTELYKYIGILTTPVEAFTANSLPILKRNITNAFYNGSLRAEIAAGNFKNVRPGDYIIGQATGSIYYVVECDYWLGNGDSTNGTTYPAYNTHHLGLMLFKPVGTTALWRGYGYSDKSWRVSAADLGRCPWNADTTVDPTDTEAIGSNSTNITRSYNGTNMSAYMGSFIRERIDAILLPQCFQADFGSENVLKRRNWLSNAINASAASGARSDWQGIASGSIWVDRFIDLASEVELYGSRINSSSRDDIGVQNKQLPIYRNGRIHDFYPRMDLWTKGVASSANAAGRHGSGGADTTGASSARWACPLGCVK